MLDFGKGKTMALTISDPFEETTARFLGRREQELLSRIAALRGQLMPLEAELAQVQQMRALLPQSDSKAPSELAKAIAAGQAFQSVVGAVVNPYAGRTIKDLTIQALIDAFPNGATVPELGEFMRTGYGRIIGQPSLRTQLHRLKAAGILEQSGPNDTWNFKEGKRGLYAMYDHPASRRDMKELRDDPVVADEIDWNDPLIKQVNALAWKDEDDKPK
jgi:hypothetical protein